MLEEELQTTDTRPTPFPWRAVVIVAVPSFGLGAVIASAVLASGALERRHIPPVAASLAVVLGFAWLTLRRSVREWEHHFGTSVEYLARRKREQEAGLRFQEP